MLSHVLPLINAIYKVKMYGVARLTSNIVKAQVHEKAGVIICYLHHHSYVRWLGSEHYNRILTSSVKLKIKSKISH